MIFSAELLVDFCHTIDNKQCLDPEVARYVEAVNEEKKKWDNYKDELKAEYNRLKKGKGSEELLNNVNYVDYLAEDDKEFLSQLVDTKKECEEYKEGLDSLTMGYKLMASELINQRKRLNQMLSRKQEMCCRAQVDLIRQTESSNKL